MTSKHSRRRIGVRCCWLASRGGTHRKGEIPLIPSGPHAVRHSQQLRGIDQCVVLRCCPKGHSLVLGRTSITRNKRLILVASSIGLFGFFLAKFEPFPNIVPANHSNSVQIGHSSRTLLLCLAFTLPSANSLLQPACLAARTAYECDEVHSVPCNASPPELQTTARRGL